MPVTIGKKPAAAFSDPLRMLSDCHRRIEMFLEALRRVAHEAGGGELSREQRKALEAALDYFRDSAPLHTRDEDKSLFPLRRIHDSDLVREALPIVDRLHEEHVAADQAHLEVDLLGRRWLKDGTLAGESAQALAATLDELSAMYKIHIQFEDSVLFPLAEKTLSAAELNALGSEMAARRGIPSQ